MPDLVEGNQETGILKKEFKDKFQFNNNVNAENSHRFFEKKEMFS